MRHHNHEHVEKVMNDLVSLRNCFCGLFVCLFVVCGSESCMCKQLCIGNQVPFGYLNFQILKSKACLFIIC